MNSLHIELFMALLASVIAPLLLGIVTFGVVFSKTFVQTFITNPFEFSTAVIKQYVITVTKIYIPLTLIWGFVSIILTLAWPNPPQQIVSSFLAGVLLTVIIEWGVLTRYPHKVRKYASRETGFYPDSLRQKVILHSIVVFQLLTLVGIFFGVLSLTQL